MTVTVRKRNGNLYTTDLKPVEWPGRAHMGPCYLLRPVGKGRTHYKTIRGFKAEYKALNP